MNPQFAFPPPAPVVRRPPPPTRAVPTPGSGSGLGAGSTLRSGSNGAGGGGARESNALRASVLDVALELGLVGGGGVGGWMFDNRVLEEGEEVGFFVAFLSCSFLALFLRFGSGRCVGFGGWRPLGSVFLAAGVSLGGTSLCIFQAGPWVGSPPMHRWPTQAQGAWLAGCIPTSRSPALSPSSTAVLQTVRLGAEQPGCFLATTEAIRHAASSHRPCSPPSRGTRLAPARR